MLTRESYILKPVEIEFELLFLFRKNDPIIIFDIGACEAEDSIRYANLFPRSTIYAFEPRTDNCQKGKMLIKEYNKLTIVLENIALSDKNGTAEFYLSDGEPNNLRNDENWDYGNKSSSLLPPTDKMKHHTDWLTFNNKVVVETKRLADYVAERKISTIDFAHIDVQGAELMVLHGAGEFIHNIKLIWMEVEAVRLYENQPLKKDVEAFMQSNSFVSILDTVNDVSGDQLYANKNFFSDTQIKSLHAFKRKLKKKAKWRSYLKSIFVLEEKWLKK